MDLVESGEEPYQRRSSKDLLYNVSMGQHVWTRASTIQHVLTRITTVHRQTEPLLWRMFIGSRNKPQAPNLKNKKSKVRTYRDAGSFRIYSRPYNTVGGLKIKGTYCMDGLCKYLICNAYTSPVSYILLIFHKCCGTNINSQRKRYSLFDKQKRDTVFGNGWKN